ncbi:hypothetical protein J2Y55_004562 [Bosea sp. BE125]|uniref:hypothetical protein n=1 Tax=Bosea sp. BE125 TaxID=2817909 RepID=UPI00286712D7|nr:hypothetical protein [Bosea sp. BE125]MDR6873535.1 hypothetical protein [Bosea sp. BE125]
MAIDELKANLAHAKDMHQLNRGWVGACIGSGSEKPGNAAIIVILFCFTVMTVALFRLDLKTDMDQLLRIVPVALGPVGLALGYLFGARDK